MEQEDINELFACIAFDPGGTTGWALVTCYQEAINYAGYSILDNLVFWACGQYTGPFASQANEMMGLVAAWPRDTAVVMEDFLLRQFRMDRTLLDPVRVMERFDQLLFNHDQAEEDKRLARLNGQYAGGAGREVGRSPSELPSLGTFVRRAPRTAFLQQPSMAMTTMTDARLQLAEESVAASRGGAAGGARGLAGSGYGFFTATKGRPHARDALRHAFTFMRRERSARLGMGGPLGRKRHSLYVPNWSPPQQAATA
jgi:hypothetical protein